MRDTKIKAALSWLKGAAVAAAVMGGGGGGGQTALASSLPPWEIEFNPGSGADEALEEAKHAYQFLLDPDAAYGIVDGLAHLRDDEEIMFHRAYYAGKAGRFDEAESIYRELIEIDSDYEWYYNALGYLLVENRYSRLDEAERLLERALDMEPYEPAIVHSYGRLLQMRGDLDAARMRYAEAKELLEGEDIDYLNPDNVHLGEIIESYAQVLMQTGNDYEFESFVGEFEDGNPIVAAALRMIEALYRNRSSAELSFLIDVMAMADEDSILPGSFQALTLYRSGDINAARRALAKAEKRIDDQTLFVDLTAYTLALSEVGATRETENALRLLIDREPDNPWYYSALGYALADSGRKTGEAVELLEQAMELEPARPEIFYAYAWALHRDGRSLEGAEMAERALSHRPQMDVYSNVVALVHYGEILWSLGREAEAVDAWRKARGVDGNHVKVLEVFDQYDLQGRRGQNS